MPPIEDNKLTVRGPEKRNLPEESYNNIKIVIINMLKECLQNINKGLKEDHKNNNNKNS